jgi:hypothetical protein
MQNSMRGRGYEPESKAPQLRVLAELATGNLATFQSQLVTLVKAFPNLLVVENGPPMLALTLDDYSIEMIRALASSSSRGLLVITPLLSSGSSSSNSRSSVMAMSSRLSQHQNTLMCVVVCMTLYHCYMDVYAVDSKNKARDMRRAQVEVAVAAKSAGAHMHVVAVVQLVWLLTGLYYK